VLKKVRTSFGPAFIWVLFIIVGSFMPSSNIPQIAISDKGIHFIFYAIFAILLYFPLRINTTRAYTFVTTSILVLLVGFALGAVVELIQHYFIVGRFGEYLDIVANTIGLLIGLLISEVYNRKAVL
tara:strand:+ start:502 stop:879 length:378 start_codon:yes stop_codon:yes gene_type:complete